MNLPIKKDYQYYQQCRINELQYFCQDKLTGIKKLTLEIGCGHGHYLSAYAEAHPQEFCLGIDRITKRVEKANAKVNKKNLKNVLFIKADSGEFLSVLPLSIEIPKLFLLFLDPWPKKRHFKKRLIQHTFLNDISIRMPPQSQLFFRTDHLEYWKWTTAHLQESLHWSCSNDSWPFEQETYFQKIFDSYRSLIAKRNEIEYPSSIQKNFL